MKLLARALGVTLLAAWPIAADEVQLVPKAPPPKAGPASVPQRPAPKSKEQTEKGVLLVPIVDVDREERTVTVRVTVRVPSFDPDSGTVSVEERTEDVSLPTAEKLQVRVPEPPTAFDDKGNYRKYTAEELKKLKGSPTLPGYTGSFDDVKPGQVVQIHLQKQKDEAKPAIAMIVVLREAPLPAPEPPPAPAPPPKPAPATPQRPLPKGKEQVEKAVLLVSINEVDREERLVNVRLTTRVPVFDPCAGVSFEERTEDAALPIAEHLQVRIPEPPPAFDSKGNYRKYTAEELKKLKGPPTLPGYTGSFENVKAGQIVQVHLQKKKDDPKPVIQMIVIVREPPPS